MDLVRAAQGGEVLRKKWGEGGGGGGKLKKVLL